MKPTTAVRDAILQNVTATTAKELEQIEQFCIDATEATCKSQDHLLDFDEYRDKFSTMKGTQQCRVDDCNDGFIVVNIDDEMLCMSHFNESIDISYLTNQRMKNNERTQN
ncbi:hypothetical protein OSG_eHP40_00155 [environmental Halophage eHP-40]|nr:hypothetical protein OSG_eHP40_00155 [environmental Halophage eHP-40]